MLFRGKPTTATAERIAWKAMRRPGAEPQRDSVQRRAAQGVSGKARRRMWLYAAERDDSCGVGENLGMLHKNAHQAILDSLEGTDKYSACEFGNAGYSPHRDEAPTASISTQGR